MTSDLTFAQPADLPISTRDPDGDPIAVDAYTERVWAAYLDLDKRPAIEKYLTDLCFDCEQRTAAMNSSEQTRHVLVDQFVIVGCEGALVIDPDLFGFDTPDWQDWTANLDARQLPGRPEGVLSLGSVEDIYGARLPVGVDLSAITIGGCTFDAAGRAELLRRIAAAGRLADAYAAQDEA